MPGTRGSSGRWTFRTQVLLLQVGVVLSVVLGAGVAAVVGQEQRIREASQDRMVTVVRAVADLPSVVEAMDDPDPAATIQPIAELIRQSSGLTYVVVTDVQGIRFSHPNPEEVGRRVSTDPGEVLSGGEMFTGTQTGSLGTTWRVKIPITDDTGDVIGMASVGILESELRGDLVDDLPELLAWLGAAAGIGLVLAGWVSRVLWRRVHRLEPEEIAALLETKEAILDGISEGVIALDPAGRVALVNHEAAVLLGLAPDVIGRPAREVLDPTLLHFLEGGPQGQSVHEGAGGEESLVLAGERVLLAQRREATASDAGVGTVMILRDRTELAQTLRSLEGERDTTQALRAQSHEFSNRMHVVSGLLELGQVDEAVRFISRAGPGEVPGQVQAPGVGDPELTALLLHKAHLGAERGIDVRLDPDSEHSFEGNSDVLTVVANLVDNAMEALVQDGMVSVLVTREADDVVIAVSDDGPGLGGQDPEAIFRVGVSSKQTTGRARGIGLALVSRIAQRRGGRVSAGDRPGGGTRVEARFPVLGTRPGAEDRSSSRRGVS